MKLFIALATLVVLAAGQNTYTSEYDDLDIDALVSNLDSLKAWSNCFVDKGPCDKAQNSFKVDMHEAVQQACAKCTSAQKVIMKKFIAGLTEKSPADYELFRQKYDPENKYFGPLAKAIA
ncbi:ejaculatory bulb-specific protein 3-like [Cydia strobilella]|uniref:ejaculatory bulb-specific protein 3-like n=1 Tax=Cydia strobilella TaxID=1100964 RepID=UPI0030059AD2